MPIFWSKDGIELTTHVGLVVGEPHTGLKWSIPVWDPDARRFEVFSVANFNFFGSKIDAPEEILKSWNLQNKFSEALEAVESTEKFAREKLLTPKIGSHVIVRRGRKVPFGTKGVVFWEGTSPSGSRIGLKSTQDGDETTYWTSSANVDVIFPGLNIGQIPDIGWHKFYTKLNREEKLRSLNIHKGDHVKMKSSSEEGKVFWASGSRIGVNNGSSQPIWTNTRDVFVLRNGTWVEEAPFPLDIKPLKSLLLDPYLVHDFPEPFNSISYLEVEDDGASQAFSEEGDLIATFPSSETYNFWKKTEALKIIRDNEIFNSFVDDLGSTI